MKILLIQLDGKLPNLALMRIANYHRERGDEIMFRIGAQFEAELFDTPTVVYASAIFKKTQPLIERLFQIYPDAIVGGTGYDMTATLESRGIESDYLDYSIYPRFHSSMGFTQRGCRLSCEFCVVPKKEGKVRSVATVADIYRGDPWPRELLLLDNDFFGQAHWRDRIKEIRDGKFKVCFVQGINARCLTDETAEAMASVDYRDDSMRYKQLYTAWDNKRDEDRLFAGLSKLVARGVKPSHIMVYMLIGYWPGETETDWNYRRQRLRDFGAIPYPMPFIRDRQTIGFQRWCVGAYDKAISWDRWKSAGYYPTGLQVGQEVLPL